MEERRGSSGASVPVVVIGSKLTHDTVPGYFPAFDAALAKANNSFLIVDCSSLEELDGDGLGILSCYAYLSQLDNAKMKLDGVKEQPGKMLHALHIFDFVRGRQCLAE